MCIMWESKGNKTLFRLNGEEALLIVTPEGMTDTFEEKEVVPYIPAFRREQDDGGAGGFHVYGG